MNSHRIIILCIYIIIIMYILKVQEEGQMQKWNTAVDMSIIYSFHLDSPVGSTLLVGCGSTVVVNMNKLLSSTNMDKWS